MHLDETIAAIATAPGGAARGIVRLSGPQVAQCLQGNFQAADGHDWTIAHQARCIAGSFQASADFPPLPCELYYWPDQRSYTRQPVAELHTLGSPPLLAIIMRAVCAAGARLAEPGEFTLRAFLSGRLDLTQAEAVLGIIDATSPGQLDTALDQLAGGLGAPLRQLRSDLLDLLAHLEAGLDFAEEDLPFLSSQHLQAQLLAAAETVERLARQMASRAEAVDQVQVVLVGLPNSGKSSLFNALVGEQAALVSPLAGTTRDYLSARLTTRGVTWELIDTAGIEGDFPVSDRLASAAQEMTQRQQRRAGIQLLCLDRTRPLQAWEQRQLHSPAPGPRLVVLTKLDAPGSIDLPDEVARVDCSSVTGVGLPELRAAIARAVERCHPPDTETVTGTAARCGQSLRHAADGLARAYALAANQGGEELVAAEIRLALSELGRVVGAVYTDDILDRIFSRFCIGK